MILRKPYAILIKNFRRIHILLSIMIFYLLYKTSSINTFLSKYILNPSTLVDPSITNSLNHITIYIVPIFIILGSILIFVLLSVKKKPITFYLFNIVTFIASLVIYTYVGSILTTLEIRLVDIRDLKLAQDFIRSLLVIQTISALITIIRATGFNVKKFDFSRELKELEIEDSDREEFEVNIEIEEGKFKRNWNRFKRYTRYVFLENKWFLFVFSLIFTSCIILFLILNVTVFNKVYKKGEYVTASDLMFKVNEIYITNLDYKGREISNQYSYVVANISIRNIMPKKFSLEPSKFYLKIGNHFFYPKEEFSKYLFDFGTVYKKTELKSEFKDYSFIFEIPKGFSKSKKIFTYLDSNDKVYKLPTKMNNIDKVNVNINQKLNDVVSLEKTPFLSSKIHIKNVKIQDMFQAKYSFCLDQKCIDSYEYILPDYKDNYDKGIIKIEGSLELDSKANMTDIYDIYTFIKSFGRLKYTVDGTEKEIYLNYNQIKPSKFKDSATYIEVPIEVINAEKITLILYIRGNSYQYSIK